MRVLILESICGFRREVDVRLFPEGFGMLRTMANEFGEAGFDAIVPLNRRVKRLAGWLDADVLLSRGGLSEALRYRPDAALVIAPESGGELERITLGLKRRGIALLGAHEGAIRASANKWLTYLALKEKVPQPRTWRRPPRGKGQVLAKPIDGVGCEGIRPLTPDIEVRDAIFQEFVEGVHASCCLLMRDGEGLALSVNGQEIATRGGFKYMGGEVPLRHELAERGAEIALRAAKVLDLRGYCGADLVLGDSSYFIELNPRVTTSFIALAQVLRTNLGELLIDALIEGDFPSKPKLRGHSIMRIPRAKIDVKVDRRGLRELREIPGIIAPPLAFDGHLRGGSPVFLASCPGGSVKGAKRRLIDAMERALESLGVDGNAIAWA